GVAGEDGRESGISPSRSVHPIGGARRAASTRAAKTRPTAPLTRRATGSPPAHPAAPTLRGPRERAGAGAPRPQAGGAPPRCIRSPAVAAPRVPDSAAPSPAPVPAHSPDRPSNHPVWRGHRATLPHRPRLRSHCVALIYGLLLSSVSLPAPVASLQLGPRSA